MKIGRLEDEIRTFEQRENDWKERNEQSQALILTQLEHINELTQDSSKNIYLLHVSSLISFKLAMLLQKKPRDIRCWQIHLQISIFY